MTISAKDAVQAAFAFFDEFVAPTGSAQIQNKLLEELKKVDGNWRVVVGFDAGRKKVSNSLSFATESSPIREYRTFTIDGITGEMLELS